MSKTDYIAILQSCNETLRRNFGIKSLCLFGSIARNEHKAESDVDVCVDTETPNPFILMDMKEYLEQLFGCPVDIVRNHKNINPFLKKRIENEGIVIF